MEECGAWNFSMLNKDEMDWGKILWMAVTAVAMPNTKVKGNRDKYWLCGEK